MARQITLGSLFDGSGGFPLAGALHGVRPVWASEIEPFPIRVTKLRFPQMKHLGSVTEVNGAEVEPVDIITFGSPCQDLSVAGKQAGIHEGQRSNLFFEAIRIIKEMRNGTANEFPRYAVWENVPGAFSSNKGEDFKAVLEAFCRICDEHADVPEPPGGKWKPAGCIVGDGWSVAWRIYDAQYWGVPQRRKRVYLIWSARTERAGEILFESEGVSGNPQPCGKARQGTPADAEGSVGGSNQDRLNALFATHPHDSRYEGPISVAQTVSSQYGTGGNNTPYVVSGADDPAYSIEGHVIDRKSEQNGRGWAEGYAHTINATDRNAVMYALDATTANSMKSANPHSGFHEETVTKTLDTTQDPTCNQGGNVIVENADGSVRCLNPHDSQAERVYDANGVHPALSANNGGGQNRSGVVVSIDKAITTGANCTAGGDCFAENVTQPCMTDRPHAVVFPTGADLYGDKTETLRAECHAAYPVIGMTANGGKANESDGHLTNVSPTIRANAATTYPAVCFVPKTKDCSDFEQADTSASLLTGYHYGSGGDAAMLVERKGNADGADDGQKD